MSEEKKNELNKNPKLRLKSWKEIQEENKRAWEEFKVKSQKRWQKFIDNINDFFGIPPNKNVGTAISADLENASNSNATPIEISTEEPIENISDVAKQEPAFKELFENEKKQSSNSDSNVLAEKWNENWKKFSENAILAFDDMRTQIRAWNMKNIEKLQDEMLNNELNWKIWLKKNELKKKQREEQRKIAAARFKAWVEENNKKVQRYFDQQKKEWEKQLEKWKREQEELKRKNKQKWIEKQQKFKEDYQRWILERRERAMEKAKYKLRVGWRQNLYIMMSLLPVIIVIVLIVALVNAITR
ncbi:MAG: hypothetical protein ACTSRZ_04065 [Promethearchaeota archaeon]